METLVIFLAQTKTAAIIEIILLLLVAGIIGYITAWLYYRSVYTKKINLLESEKADLNKKIDTLNTESNELRKKLSRKDVEIEKLNNEINELKGSDRSNEQDTLDKISKRKNLLDYGSFGTASVADKDDLKLINGIGPFIEKKLNALEIFTFKQISKFTAKDVEAVNKAIEFFPGRIERDNWVGQAKELADRKH
jgi:predicted flap endonuclease-1-like 5' DNA nuclease